MDIKPLNVCQCCLAEDRKMKSMTDHLVVAKKSRVTISSCYSACSGVNLSQSQLEIPRNICKPCEKILIKAYEFRELCQESDRLLQERFGLLTEVKKETVSDEEVEKEYLYAESKPDPEQPSQVFNQVFLRNQPEVALNEAVIKIEDDLPDPTPEKDDTKEVPENLEAVKAPESDDNGIEDYEPEPATATSDEMDDVKEHNEPKGERKKYENLEVDELNGKFLCYQCDLVLHSIREYREHRKMCLETRKKQSCKMCNETVKGYKRHLEEKHKDYKPFECGTCNAKYANFNSLRIHLYYHTKRKTFHCMAKWCGLRFRKLVL
jgi:Zinc-finger associated domain (zf-AD)